MRTSLLVAIAGLTLVAAAGDTQKIVFARVFPQPEQIGLFMAAADGSHERALGDPAGTDYDAAFAPDGSSIIFTSERNGSADLYTSSSMAAAWSDSPTARRTTTRPRSRRMESKSPS